MAVAGNTVYVATINLALEFTSTAQVDGTISKSVSIGGSVEALNLVTGKVEWATKVDGLPLGAATVSNNLVFTSLLEGRLLALNRTTGAIVFSRKLPRTTNSTLAVAGNTVIVLAGGPGKGKVAPSQIIAYRLS
jgi:alcohol dehydrogenase (cytochrome c)